MKIIHISDVHIRNLKYHEEYRRVFDNLYKEIERIKPDFVINTGDTAHTKTQISPEFVDLCSHHIRSISNICDYHILLGNHDLNLMNPNRQDAITPIVESIGRENVFLHKKSGVVSLNDATDLYVFSCADKKNYPLKEKELESDKIKIGLYHGVVHSAVTDSNWEMKDSDVNVDFFKGLDFVLLGDIHKHQFLDSNNRIAYAGSLIQQNFGEDNTKGFLLWDINGKNDWNVEHVHLEGSRRFFTLRLENGLKVPANCDVEPGARVRVLADKSFTAAEQVTFENEIRNRFHPYDIVSVPPQSISNRRDSQTNKIRPENLRDITAQEELLRKFFKGKNLNEDVLNTIFELNKKFQIEIEKNEDVTRDVFWSLKSLAWSNLFNYGEDNFIDFSKIKGINGLFAPNSAGKSSFIDIILETLFDKTTKDVSKNLFLVNDNKKVASMVAKISIGDEDFIVERKIEKLKYGQRKLDETKEWGKTSLNFYLVDEDGNQAESLNGQLRPETERAIRKRFGTFEDFVLTSLLAQSRDSDIIKCKETDRRKILYKFLDLDIFEQKGRLAKEEGKKHFQKLKDFDANNLENLLSKSKQKLEEAYQKINELKKDKNEKLKDVQDSRENISRLLSMKEGVGQVLSEEDIERSWSHARDRFNEHLKLYNDLLDEETKLRARLADLREEYTTYDANKIKKDIEHLNKLISELDVSEKMLTKQKNMLSQWKKEVSILDSVPCGNSFPTCQFLINAFEKKSQTKSIEDEISKTEKSKELAERLISDFKENSDDPNELLKRFTTIKDLILEIQSKLKGAEISKENCHLKMANEWREALRADLNRDKFKKDKDAIKKNEKIDHEIRNIESNVKKIEESIKSIDERIIEHTKNVAINETVAKNVTEQLKSFQQLKDLCNAYEYYSEAMGKYGIAYHILVEKLPILNEEINKILSFVVDFSVLLEHDSEEQTIKMHIKYGDYPSRPIELAGGAEKMISSIAIRVALLRITNLPKTNMFIIDEGFGSLDVKNVDSINKMFDYLRSVFEHVIIISHIDVMKDLVDNNIEISSDDESYSHIEV